MKSTLAVRLYADVAIEGFEDMAVWRQDFDEVVALLVYDFPTHVELVSKDHVEAWGMSQDEVMEIAIDNVIAQCPPMIESIEEYGVHLVMNDGAMFFLLPNEMFEE